MIPLWIKVGSKNSVMKFIWHVWDYYITNVADEFRNAENVSNLCLGWNKNSLRLEIWKRSFISTVRPTIHTNPSPKRSFPKALSKAEEFENAAFGF